MLAVFACLASRLGFAAPNSTPHFHAHTNTLHAPLQGVAQGKAAQAQFDAAAASALVELPEYRADGLQVALCVLQYLSWVVQANAQRKDKASKPGPAEVALAKRLLEVVKTAGAAEATGVDLKEWCRRIGRSLSSAAEQEAAHGHSLVHTGAGGPAFSIAAPPTQGKGVLQGGYNAVAGFNALGFGGGGSSSDDDDDDDDDDDSGAGGQDDSSDSDMDAEEDGSDASRGDEEVGESSDSSSDDSDKDHHTTERVSHHHHHHDAKKEGDQSPRATRRAKKQAAKEREREEIARSNLLVGNPDASSGAWGYPFTGPRARTLFISRRSRRHRLMRWHLAAALANSRAEAGAGPGDQVGGGGGGSGGGGLTLAAVGSTDDTGPVFSAGSGFRLDKRAFWDSLLPGSGATSGWEELTGPSDPVVLSACYTLEKQGGAELLITLRAYNRCVGVGVGVGVWTRRRRGFIIQQVFWLALCWVS